MSIRTSLFVLATLVACNRNDNRGTPDNAAEPASPARGTAPLATAPLATAPNDTGPISPNTEQRGAGQIPALAGGGSTATAEGTTGHLRGAAGERSKDHREAEADFKGAIGIKLNGDAKFEEVPGGVKVKVDIDHTPVGRHGIHVHEKPDCRDIPGMSMGEHWNPTGKPHGLPPSLTRHLGDLGNINVDKSGEGKLEFVIPGANLKANDPMSLINRALVVHDSEDKGTQPSGDSGKPIACAVIKED